MAKAILAYGETLWDLLPSGAALGGAPFNFAYRASSLGDRAITVTRLGRDALGREAFHRIGELGMDTRFVQWDETAPTGTVEVDLSDPNSPDFHIVPGVAYDNIELTEELLIAASQADCLCFGTLAQRTERARLTLQALLAEAGRAVKLLDVNLRKECYTAGSVASSLSEADVLKLNDQEARELNAMLEIRAGAIPAFADAMMDRWRLSHCVVTFGERGAFAAAADGEKAYAPGFKVEMEDTCGSGDAFTAGFIHKLLQGGSLGECLRLGNALGALVATREGGTAPIALDEIRAFLEGRFERIAQPELRRFTVADEG